MSDTNPTNITKRPVSSYSYMDGLRAGVLGGALAAIGNLVLYFIGLAVLSDRFVVSTGPGGSQEPVSLLNVVLYSFVPGVVAGLLLALLNRTTNEPVQIMLGISVSFLLFSFTAPLGLPSIPDWTRVVLAAMHVVAAIAIIGILLRSWRR